MSDATLQVGVISETLVQQHHLRHIVEKCGYEVKVAWLVNQVLKDIHMLDRVENIDVWLIDVDIFSQQQNDQTLCFERWLFDLKQPVIFGEGTTYNAVEEAFNSWSRQLASKLMSISGQQSLIEHQRAPASYVWVLAASTGGPESVKSFLDNLPLGLGVAFLYVQHIEPNYNRSLATIITRDNDFSSQVAEHGGIIVSDMVTVVPVDKDIVILPNGTLIVRSQSWRGEYRPSIDQVVAMVADRFGPKSGAIFFSGMGDDGAMGARLMARQGGQIWIQSPATCVSAAMPQAINQTGTVTTIGSPKQLADSLAETVRGFSSPAIASVS